ncbi:leucyl aminopeptidase family protein [Tamaricihabitans halophyticus]|nr:leucyl aminopeptidase [Tamaricihabitans halophyticus]
MLPPVPGSLPDVRLATAAGRGVPRVVLAGSTAQQTSTGSAGEQPAWYGPEAAALPADWLAELRPRGKAGELHRMPLAGGGPNWLLGVGAGTPEDWRSAAAALIRGVDADAERERDAGRRVARVLAIALPAELDTAALTAFVHGLRLGGYRYLVSGDRKDQPTREIRLVASEPSAQWQGALAEAIAQSSATALARDLANSPSNVKNPDWMARLASKVAEGTPGLRAEIRDEHWLTEHRFGGMLAVGGGSASPPRLIELSWRPRGARGHLVLVGKGITFDTGGISVKPADGMHLMRTDMAGGAAVVAALRAIAELRLPVRVTGLVPCAENLISGGAYRPGDVVRQYGGTTTEITNTDAEGRLVLADALAYAVRRHKPDALIDVATLTGAMKVSLGLRTGGLFSNTDELAEELTRAGASVGESWWRMPLLADSAEAVRGELGDVRQCPPGPGGITAALFLREFTDGLPWAHLDIAGPARAEKTYADVVAGATGFAARTLIEFVSRRSDGRR